MQCQQRIFQLKYADARDLANVLGVFGYGINANRDLNVLAVSAPIDLTVYLVVASEQPSAADGLQAGVAAGSQ